MNTDDTFCSSCNDGVTGSGRACSRCRGTGRKLCDICLQAPAVDVIERGRWELDADDLSEWVADPRAPGVALCEHCLSDASHTAPTEPPPPAPDTWPAPANEDGEPLAAELCASLTVADAAREAGLEPYEAFRALRRSAARAR